jgi:general secretion pathway protein D
MHVWNSGGNWRPFAKSAWRTLPIFIVLALAACGTTTVRRDAGNLLLVGDYESAMNVLNTALRRWPDDIELKSAVTRTREVAASQLSAAAISQLGAGQLDAAEVSGKRLQAIDPGNPRASALLLEVARARRSQSALQDAEKALASGSTDVAMLIVESALKDNPGDTRLIALQRRVELEQRARDEASRRSLAERRPVTLAFREAGLQALLEALTKATGVNFILDKDVRPDIRATVFLRDTRLEDALELVTRTNQLSMKILDSSTVLIYPNTPDKQREYQDLVVRGFYLSSVPAKQAAQTLQTLLRVRDVVIDERANLLIVRDTPERIRLAERLLALQDVSEPEVMLEVEVLEVNISRLTELGIQYPDSMSFTPLSVAGGSQLTLQDLQNLNSSRIGVTTPTATVNLRRELGDSKILANPRIRAKNKEKARILIGDKLPVITSTATSTGFVTQNVQYLDVGLKLEVESLVQLDDEVSMKVSLEVSSLAREIRTTSGLVAYQIGTRSASTTLQLKDGQTQLLAGLISRSERGSASRIPGLGDLPGLGRIFGSQKDEATKTEIVLSITPRIVRNVRRPDVNFAEFWSGTEASYRLRPLSLGKGATADPAAPSGGPANAAAPSTTSSSGQLPSASQQAAARLPPGAPVPQTATPAAVAPLNLPAGTQWGLRIDAPSKVAAASTFTVRLIARADAPVRGIPVELVFDAERLLLTDVVEGDLLAQGGVAVSTSKQIDAETGRAVFGVMRNTNEGVSGTGVLATLSFKAKQAGTARISVQSATAIGAGSSTGAPLPNVVIEISDR